MGAIEQSLEVLCRCLKVERCSNLEYSPCFFWDGIRRGAFVRAPRLSARKRLLVLPISVWTMAF